MQSCKTFVCEYPSCGKSFTKSSNLAQHNRIHTGERPYSCDICGRCFRQTGNLTKHLRSHQSAHLRWNRDSNEKPFKCEYPGCIKSFTAKSSLQKHSLTHNTESPTQFTETPTASSSTISASARPASFKFEPSNGIESTTLVAPINQTDETIKQSWSPSEILRKSHSSELIPTSYLGSPRLHGDGQSSSAVSLLGRRSRRDYETERDDVNNLLNVLLSDSIDSNVAESQQQAKAATRSGQQVHPKTEISPKARNQSNFVPPQSTDGDDYKFIEIIEHYFQVNEGDTLLPSSRTDSTAGPSRAAMDRACSASQSGSAQSTDNDENNFLDILEEICRDCSTES